MTRRAVTLATLESEKQFQRRVIELAEACGWMAYHTWRSDHSPAGFPDVVLIRAPRCVVMELKREGGQPTAEQQEWLEGYMACGFEAGCWWPSDWDAIVKLLT